jgi:tetratricopeptide (TPR) repeat protein
VAQEPSDWIELKTNFQSAVGWIAKSASISNIIGLTWIVIWVVTCVLVGQDLARDVVIIEPISVPRTLSDNGYTPEVASHRLHDAINHYASVNKASSLMEALNIAPRDELPDFVVPKIDLSLNAIVSSIRSVLHYGSGRRISGELIFRDKLALRLRVDGQQVYSSEFDSESPDELLANAAPAVMEKIQPYVSAIALYRDHPEQAVEKADDIIVRLKESDVNVQWAYMLKGNYFFDRENYVEAEKILRKAVSLNWSNPSPHINLGRTLQRQRKLDDAIAQYRRVIGMNPRSAVAYNNLGTALGEKAGPNGKLDDAIAEYHHAIEMDRNYALPHNNLGLALYHQGNADDAIVEYHRAIQLDPKYANPHANLGIVLYHEGKADDAAAEYRRAIEIDPKNANPHLDLGVVLYHQGNANDAAAEYRRAIEIDPKNAIPHNDLGLALSDQGQTDDAIVEYHRAIQLDPKYANPHANLGAVLYHQGKTDDAVAEYRRAIEMDPKSAVAYYGLGLALYDQGQTDDAIAEYRRAIEIVPNYKNARENLEKALRAKSAAK